MASCVGATFRPDFVTTGVEDELLSHAPTSELNLTGEGALMPDEEARDGARWATSSRPSAEQDRIIRRMQTAFCGSGGPYWQNGGGSHRPPLRSPRACPAPVLSSSALARLALHDQVLPLVNPDVVSTTIEDLVPACATITEPAMADIKGGEMWAELSAQFATSFKGHCLSRCHSKSTANTVHLTPEMVEAQPAPPFWQTPQPGATYTPAGSSWRWPNS